MDVGRSIVPVHMELTWTWDIVFTSSRMSGSLWRADELSTKKKRARNAFFGTLGYRRLQFCSIAHPESETSAKADGAAPAKANLPFCPTNGDLDFNHWRGCDVSCPRAPSSDSTANAHMVDVPCNILKFFSDDTAVCTWDGYLGFYPDGNFNIYTQSDEVAGSIVALVRFNAFTATTFIYLREDGTDKVRGHIQKLYHDTFAGYLLEANNQLIGSVRVIVQEWRPMHLCLSTLSATKFSVITATSPKQNATIEIYVPSLKRRLFAVFWYWFREFMSTELGATHDWSIAEYDANENIPRPLETPLPKIAIQSFDHCSTLFQLILG